MIATTDTNTQILEILKEILKWTKVASYKNVQALLENNLDSDIKKIIYFLSDGEKSQDEVVLIGNVGAGTISKYWNEWSKIGLGDLVPVKRGNRFKRIFNPEDFGIEIPKIDSIKGDKH